MAKLSIIIPSRDERFLTPTIDDIFRNARGEIEVVAILDSDKWPIDWAEVTARHPNLHTIHNGSSRGMRVSINKGVGSAISRGAEFIMKLDAHCSLSEGFDEVLKADCDDDWVVIPRRGRLDPENWCATDTHKPDIDYHYLSFPSDPNDFGGPGLNGKVWDERAVERKDIEIDDEMSSQGSCWFMRTDYFQRLELMDEASYGKFWNEMQEIGLKCWLSGGRMVVNKRAKYLHLHKGRKYGRGYKLEESALTQGRNHTMKWLHNEAWAKQTLPFKWLINHFWPVPGWPEDWEEKLYATRKPRLLTTGTTRDRTGGDDGGGDLDSHALDGLQIHTAYYGVDEQQKIDVVARVRELVKNDSLDIVVNNSTLTPSQNPFRGKKKVLSVVYSYDGLNHQLVQRSEKDWLIIGQPGVLRGNKSSRTGSVRILKPIAIPGLGEAKLLDMPSISAPALNDYLIRKFSISPQRLRAPMPIELPNFHRDDLAQLFAELGFKRGAEIGVAEGHYSEVLLKANPELELLLVDPWGDYEGNPQTKGSKRHIFAYDETCRKTEDYRHRKMVQATSMEAVKDVEVESLDFCYIDGNHSFDFVMQDLIEWFKRVRSGGIVSGDDYYHLSDRWGAGPVEAVQAYTNAHNIAIWFICNAHKSVDFFWVKP